LPNQSWSQPLAVAMLAFSFMKRLLMPVAIAAKTPLRFLLLALSLPLLGYFTGVSEAAAGTPPPSASLDLMMDASEAMRNILHAVEKLPATGARSTYEYPKWIPGEHGPTGPITDFTGLHFFAGGKELPWTRDDVNMYAFHVNAPEGITEIEAHFDQLLPVNTPGFSSSSSATANLLILSWNQAILYPLGAQSDNVEVTAHLKIPPGWKFGTALPVASQAGQKLDFKPTTLTTLVDSPVLMGVHFREIPLGEDMGRSHFFDIASDSEAALQVPEETILGLKQVVKETGALFGARHYRTYHFLVTLSDATAHFGLEHHESSDDRTAERSLIDDQRRWRKIELYTHEMTHSWNGKYRRPAGLATGNYHDPMKGEMLWVYEGLTEYLGEILPPRAGLLNKNQWLELEADSAAMLDNRSGRTWRPLQDTATDAQDLYPAPKFWEDWRRSVDYYPEGTLCWLEADVIIRTASKGTKSLDNFAQKFYGPPNSDAKVVPYTFDDVVNALNEVQPNDWRGFWTERLNAKSPRAPLAGFVNGGWKLTYTDKKPKLIEDAEATDEIVDARYSLGLWMDNKGKVIDVLGGSLADKAGLAPGMTIVAVNGRAFKDKVMYDAVKYSKASSGPIELIATTNDFYKTYSIDYHGGERYPKFVRDDSKPDLVSEIIATKAGSVPAQPKKEQ
jgi:predicted metalloprotease with PDZ domain